ncbi:MAG TPA: hypothetical protein VFB06_34440 [Streptosporangiaceae bacterium]|nr:hypothetical protein [Streptosporangiaceae bacterium]
MVSLSRDPNDNGDAPAHTYPIARTFALVVLGALVLLIVLRHLFGSVRVEVGAS